MITQPQADQMMAKQGVEGASAETQPVSNDPLSKLNKIAALFSKMQGAGPNAPGSSFAGGANLPMSGGASGAPVPIA